MPRSGVVGWKPSVFKRAREEKGLTAAELARRAGLSGTVVGRYEQEGGSAPTPETLLKLAVALGVPPRQFIDFRQAGWAGRRAVLGLTQDQVVEQVDDPDLNVQTYRALEAGRTRRLRAAQARSLARFFGVSEGEVRAEHEQAVARRQESERVKGEGEGRTPSGR